MRWRGKSLLLNPILSNHLMWVWACDESIKCLVGSRDIQRPCREFMAEHATRRSSLRSQKSNTTSRRLIFWCCGFMFQSYTHRKFEEQRVLLNTTWTPAKSRPGFSSAPKRWYLTNQGFELHPGYSRRPREDGEDVKRYLGHDDQSKYLWGGCGKSEPCWK